MDHVLSAGPGVLQAGGHEDRGEIARLQYFVGAIAVGDLVKSTYGPRGMDKILQPGGGDGSRPSAVSVTNDGATILKSVWLDNPAAKILVELSKQQDKDCGDGTTGVVIIAAELLRQAEILVDKKLHPQVICAAYRLAYEEACKTLVRISFDSRVNQTFHEDLLNIARTTLSSKLLSHEKDHFAKLAVDAVLRLKGKPNLDYIQIIKRPGGTLGESYLCDGFILPKRIGTGQPKKMANCRIMVANTPMDTDKIKIYGARVKVDSFSAVQALEEAERQKMKNKVNKIINHGCNIFINRQLIYNYPDQLFKAANVMAIEHSDFDGMERLAAVLGADIVSTFDTPDRVTLGSCESVEEILVGEEKMIKFSGCAKNEASTIVLAGANAHLLDEAERSLHDALAVLSQTVLDTKVIYGGGSSEMAMAEDVEKLSRTIAGKKAVAVEAFATALRQIPTILLDNGGFDSAETLGKLRVAHHEGIFQTGVDIETGGVADMGKLGVLESFKSKYSALCGAAEAAEALIRVDDIIRCAPRERRGM